MAAIEHTEIPELRRIRALCSLLGNPEQQLRCIHVTGTNGKGSVCRYLYEALRALGYSVGLYTSPHLLDVRERFEIDGEMISPELYRAYESRVETAAAELLDAADPPTEFEILTAIGFLYFAESPVDFVVLEAGLGGLRDATNVIAHPLVAIITQVALDHTDRLGSTIEAIAAEKAGIIKPNSIVVSGATAGAADIIAEAAQARQALWLDAATVERTIRSRSIDGYTFDADILGHEYLGVELSMPGEHQVQNAITALCALESLSQSGLIDIDEGLLRRGIKAAVMKARIQVVSKSPLVIVDGAHNPDGASALVKTLKELLPEGRFLFVCSFLKDKSVQETLKVFAQAASAFVVSASGDERSLGVAALSRAIQAEGCPVVYEAASAADAYQSALRLGADYDAIVVAGSLYAAGDFLPRD